MKRQWRVTLVDYGRPKLVMRARNVDTGKVLSRTCTGDRRKDCTREAGEWEAKLNADGHVQCPKFSEARARFEAEYLPSRRQSTAAKFDTVFNAFAQAIGDPKLDTITEATISDFSRVYGAKVKPATLAGALRHLKAFTRWANRQKLMPKAVHFEMPRGVNKAKGRPLTGEEFERVLAKVPEVRPTDAEAWAYLMRGLWESGLRLAEAVGLSWDDQAPVAVIGMETGRPRIRIEAEAQKGGRLTESPVTPDFAQLLEETPVEQRRGRVFKISTSRVDNASSTIVQFFRRAGVKGSAHDFRRSFATKWARRLPAQALQRLMRHSSLATTMTFYATGDIGLEDQLWGDFGNKTGNTALQPTEGKTHNTLKK